MANMNKCFIIGRVSSDIDHRVCKTGLSVASFSVACNEKTKNGDLTTFINIKTYGKVADICKQYIGKGSEILVEGKYRIDTWEDRKNNIKRYNHYIMGEVVQFMGGRQNCNDKGAETQNTAISDNAQPVGKYPPAELPQDSDDDDIIPF